eukprot:Rhum_TRINITY_DN23030_c0_g2::Rhum_TRINITY_DN23030_c0_g2_i1::g.176921::m.176921
MAQPSSTADASSDLLYADETGHPFSGGVEYESDLSLDGDEGRLSVTDAASDAGSAASGGRTRAQQQQYGHHTPGLGTARPGSAGTARCPHYVSPAAPPRPVSPRGAISPGAATVPCASRAGSTSPFHNHARMHVASAAANDTIRENVSRGFGDTLQHGTASDAHTNRAFPARLTTPDPAAGVVTTAAAPYSAAPPAQVIVTTTTIRYLPSSDAGSLAASVPSPGRSASGVGPGVSPGGYHSAHEESMTPVAATGYAAPVYEAPYGYVGLEGVNTSVPRLREASPSWQGTSASPPAKTWMVEISE